MSITFAHAVRDELETDLENTETAILSGVTDMLEYRHLTGKRHGLKQALAILDGIEKRFDSLQ